MCLAAGLTLGAANSLANALGSAYGPFVREVGTGIPALEHLGAWLGSGWAYAAVASGLGFALGSGRRVLLGPLLALLVAIATYYAVDHALGINERYEWVSAGFWALVALVIGPLFGLLGSWARGIGAGAAAAGLALPALMIAEQLYNPRGPDHIHDTSPWIVSGLAVALAAAHLTAWARRRRPTSP